MIVYDVVAKWKRLASLVLQVAAIVTPGIVSDDRKPVVHESIMLGARGKNLFNSKSSHNASSLEGYILLPSYRFASLHSSSMKLWHPHVAEKSFDDYVKKNMLDHLSPERLCSEFKTPQYAGNATTTKNILLISLEKA
ncbi:unnamed protein product [Dovyalis caffra]|uniref:Uncharacterized protein n=1 Tax=Dovyalis caffra TaxID=77055 RepID=A0AAV1RU59_9ROSI|nr:unnamed protein product [Dovyalis caffra]